MSYEYLDNFTEETVKNFFEESFFPISDVWNKIEYRIFATTDPATKWATDADILVPLGIALYLLPENEKNILPPPKPISTDIFELSIGQIPFSKEALLKVLYQFIQPPQSGFVIDSKKFVLWGEPENPVYYQHFYDPDNKGSYSLAFPITMKRKITQSEIEMLGICYETVESKIKRQMGDRLENIVQKLLGPTTKFYQTHSPDNNGIFLTVHVPAWIRLLKAILNGRSIEVNITAPQNILPASVRAVLDSGHSEEIFEHITDVKGFPLAFKIELPSNLVKIQLKLFCKDLLIQDVPVYNSGLTHPIAKVIEIVRGSRFKDRISDLKNEKPVKPNRFDQIVTDLFNALGFICVRTGKSEDRADIVAFFEGNKGLYECLVIETSESTKEHPEVNTLFERTKKLSKEIGCKAYPVFLTNASRDEIRNPKDYERVLLLTKEESLDLMEKAERNEPLHETIRFLMAKTMFLTDIDYDIKLAKPAEATLSVYLNYKPKNTQS